MRERAIARPTPRPALAPPLRLVPVARSSADTESPVATACHDDERSGSGRTRTRAGGRGQGGGLVVPRPPGPGARPAVASVEQPPLRSDVQSPFRRKPWSRWLGGWSKQSLHGSSSPMKSSNRYGFRRPRRRSSRHKPSRSLHPWGSRLRCPMRSRVPRTPVARGEVLVRHVAAAERSCSSPAWRSPRSRSSESSTSPTARRRTRRTQPPSPRRQDVEAGEGADNGCQCQFHWREAKATATAKPKPKPAEAPEATPKPKSCRSRLDAEAQHGRHAQDETKPAAAAKRQAKAATGSAKAKPAQTQAKPKTPAAAPPSHAASRGRPSREPPATTWSCSGATIACSPRDEAAGLELGPSWRYEGRVVRLTAGDYRWYVWPVTKSGRATQASIQAKLSVS